MSDPIPSSDRTLRDDFAIAALHGYLAGRKNPFLATPTSNEPKENARACYLYADAMLEERGTERPPPPVLTQPEINARQANIPAGQKYLP